MPAVIGQGLFDSVEWRLLCAAIRVVPRENDSRPWVSSYLLRGFLF